MSSSVLPPHPFAPGRATGRRRLSQEAIVAAALEILAADGLDAVTMRAVAQRLGTGPASLYAHVRDKDDLHRLMLDEVFGEVEVPDPDPDRWQEQMKETLRNILAVYGRHPGIAAVNFGSIPYGPHALRASEKMLAILRSGGVPKWACGLCIDTLSLYPTAVAHEDQVWASRSPDAADPKAAEMQSVELIRDYFHALPVSQFPLMVDMADDMSKPDGEARFEFGLELLVGGLARLAEREGPSPEGDR